jgi:membrane fusion protein (multidrug efflux system)
VVAKLGILTAALWFAACTGGDPAAATSAPPATTVKVMTVVGTRSMDTLEATGVIETLESVTVQPEAAGVVEAVFFEDGAAVLRGQRLVQLRDAETRAAVDEAEARLGLAQLALDRMTELRAGDNVAQADLDKAKAERDLARAQLARAREGQRRMAVVAPFDGVAGRRQVAPGQVVNASTPVTRVDTLDPVTVDLELPEGALATVRSGQTAKVTVAALPGREFQGQVVYLAPRASETARTLEARIKVPNPERLLRPGLTASVVVDVGEVEGAVWVPTYAVVQTAGGPVAWVKDTDGKAQSRSLTLGRREAEQVRVLSGLTPGDTLILEGFTRLKPGSPVSSQETAP